MVSHMVIEAKAGSSLSFEAISTVRPCVPCVFCIRPVLFDILIGVDIMCFLRDVGQSRLQFI